MDRHHRRRRSRWARNGLIAAWGKAVECIAPSRRKSKGSPRQQADTSSEAGETMGYSYLPEDIQHHIHSQQADTSSEAGETMGYSYLPEDIQRHIHSQQADTSSEAGETMGYSYLPEDIQRHIHTLIPLRDAARAACVSRAFLSSWRSRPSLTLSKETLGLDEDARGKDGKVRDFPDIIDGIMRKHSGHMKIFKLLKAPDFSVKDRRYLDSWLHTAVTSGIEELTLSLKDLLVPGYEFPCSLLSNGVGDSIRSLYLYACAFRPTNELGCFKSLTKLSLLHVLINGDELGCFLSNAFALESLEVWSCSLLECVKIPRLQRFSFLNVMYCDRLQVIESKAPNLNSFYFRGEPSVRVSLGQALQVKNLYLSFYGVGICCTRAELTSSSIPSIETLGIHSNSEIVKTPLARSKLLHLKYVSVYLRELTFDWSFDYSSAGSCPSLQTFVLDVSRRLEEDPKYETVSLNPYAMDWVHLTCHMLRAWLS